MLTIKFQQFSDIKAIHKCYFKFNFLDKKLLIFLGKIGIKAPIIKHIADYTKNEPILSD